MLAVVCGEASGQTRPAESAAAPPAPPANVATSPDVNLSPNRVVIASGQRAGDEIVVFNRSRAKGVYAIELVDEAMTPDGAIKPLKEVSPAERAKVKTASEWLRYSPRRVTLDPNQSQTVRVLARRPADLATGEYRTHFTVTAVPPEETGTSIAQAVGQVAPGQIAIRLTPVYGISIPIIVRQGELTAKAGFANIKAVEQAGRRAVNFDLTREGDRSIYGDIEVLLMGAGAPKRIALVRGLAVYPEINQRSVSLPLAQDAPKIGSGSKIRLVFTDEDFKKGAVLAQADVTLP